MPAILVQLVQLGFLGFSVALMLLSYNLLRNIRRDFRVGRCDIEMFRQLCIEARWYMGVSVVVIIVGLVWTVYTFDPAISIRFDVYPKVDGYAVKIGGSPIDLVQKVHPVKNDEVVGIDLVELNDVLGDLENKCRDLEKNFAGLVSTREKEKGVLAKEQISFGDSIGEAGI